MLQKHVRLAEESLVQFLLQLRFPSQRLNLPVHLFEQHVEFGQHLGCLLRLLGLLLSLLLHHHQFSFLFSCFFLSLLFVKLDYGLAWLAASQLVQNNRAVLQNTFLNQDISRKLIWIIFHAPDVRSDDLSMLKWRFLLICEQIRPRLVDQDLNFDRPIV